jgi:hypothetical protein
MGIMGLNSVVSWLKEQWGMDPSTLSEMRPGSYDIHERIRDMNRNGVLASMCFPTFPGFSGRTFQEAAEIGDPALALIMLQAYNDWHIDEWCGAYPGRFMPLALPPEGWRCTEVRHRRRASSNWRTCIKGTTTPKPISHRRPARIRKGAVRWSRA